MNQENKKITKEELLEMIKNHELSDDELEGVAGGNDIDYENMTDEEIVRQAMENLEKMKENIYANSNNYNECYDYMCNQCGDFAAYWYCHMFY